MPGPSSQPQSSWGKEWKEPGVTSRVSWRMAQITGVPEVSGGTWLSAECQANTSPVQHSPPTAAKRRSHRAGALLLGKSSCANSAAQQKARLLPVHPRIHGLAHIASVRCEGTASQTPSRTVSLPLLRK